MTALLSLSRQIDGLNLLVGRTVPWLLLVCILVSVGNAISRYALSISSNAWLELQYYLFAAVFLLCSGYTLLKNEHIRVDVVNSKLPERTRLWIDVFGILFFLFPVIFLLQRYGIPFVMEGIESGERSNSPGGLIRWPLYILMPIGLTLLGLQGISELVKRIALLQGIGGVEVAKSSVGMNEPGGPTPAAGQE